MEPLETIRRSSYSGIGVNIINGEEIAIKLEAIRARHPQLEYESKVYKALAGGGTFQSTSCALHVH